jgi:hypothetical protein
MRECVCIYIERNWVRNLGAARNGGIAIWNMTGIVASTTGAGGGVVPKLLHMDG